MPVALKSSCYRLVAGRGFLLALIRCQAITLLRLADLTREGQHQIPGIADIDCKENERGRRQKVGAECRKRNDETRRGENREIGGKRAETEPVGSVFDRCAGEADQHYRRVAESGDRDQYNADLAILYERNEAEQQKGC